MKYIVTYIINKSKYYKLAMRNMHRIILHSINSHIFNRYIYSINKLNYVNYYKCRSEQEKNDVNIHINIHINYSMKYK